jgi:hypothetical protein
LLNNTSIKVTTLNPEFPTRAQIQTAIADRKQRLATASETTKAESDATSAAVTPKTLNDVFIAAIQTVQALPEPPKYYMSDEQIGTVKAYIEQMMVDVIDQASKLPSDSDYTYQLPRLITTRPVHFFEGIFDESFFTDHGHGAVLRMINGKVGVNVSFSCNDYSSILGNSDKLIDTQQNLCQRIEAIGTELRQSRTRTFINNVLNGSVVPVHASNSTDKQVIAYPYILKYENSSTTSTNLRVEQNLLFKMLFDEFQVTNVKSVKFSSAGDTMQIQIRFTDTM